MKIFQVFLLFLLCFTSLYSETQANFEKTKIAVLDFRLQGNNFETEDMGKIVALDTPVNLMKQYNSKNMDEVFLKILN